MESNFSTTHVGSESLPSIPAEGKPRIQLFGIEGKVHAVAYEVLQNNDISLWQRFRLFTGGLVKHTIIQKDGKSETVLLNTASLAKRLGISHKQLESLNEVEELKLKLAEDPAAEKLRKKLAQKQAATSLLPQLLRTQIELAKALTKAYGKDEQAFFKKMQGFVKKVGSGDANSFFEAAKNVGTLKLGNVGRGAFGLVDTLKLQYAASDGVGEISLKGLVLKTAVFKQDKKALSKSVKSFENEYRTLRALSDSGAEMTGIQELPHKVISDGSIGILMRRYDGDLRNVQINQEQERLMIRQLLTGLATLHKNNIIHGDIKPDNVLVKDLNTGEPKFHIADFGGCKTKKEHQKAFGKAVKELKELKRLKKKGLSFSGTKATDLKGTYTMPYDPDNPANWETANNIVSRESAAVEKGNFDEWFAARQKADCFAMALSFWEKLGPLVIPAYASILQDMFKGNVTAQQTLDQFEALWKQ